jgi:hypothetical protein
MPADNRVNHVMAIIADRHGEFHFVLHDLPGFETRLRRDDVVERRQHEPSAGREADAEILGVAIRCRQQPEHDLRFEKRLLVALWCVAACEKIRDFADAGAAVGFVFAGGRNRKRLTAILLRQTQQPSVTGPRAVEAFDGEHAPTSEIDDARFGDRQAKRGDELQA